MTQLTPEQVRHIAALARLTLSDQEVTKFAKDLTSILGYIEHLSEVPTEGVEELSQVTGKTNTFREDALLPPITDPDSLLQTSPLPIVDHQIAVPSAHGER